MQTGAGTWGSCPGMSWSRGGLPNGQEGRSVPTTKAGIPEMFLYNEREGEGEGEGKGEGKGEGERTNWTAVVKSRVHAFDGY